MVKKVKIVEVGVRDGLQNEAVPLSVETRLEMINDLVEAGLKHIEVGAFVSPKWVPQMKGTSEIVATLKHNSSPKVFASHYSVLVPNLRGMEDALKSGIKEVAIFGSCSEGFSKRNINCTIKESFSRFHEVMDVAKKHKIRVRGYLSTAFGCPYDGDVSSTYVVKLVEKMLDLGVYEVSIGDTIGVAVPSDVRELLKKLSSRNIPFHQIAMHFHDTRGTALANVLASLDLGIRVFDSSVGGLGGCPYAEGALGNLATEDLAYMLQKMGYKTDLNIEKLIEIRKWISRKLDRPLPSHVGVAGLPKQKPFL
ncbi:MAG: hydroxymethylglutaryl-CoA lyase [Bdellovibrionales bacterium]|nr:hydroxymethylglutaryl-CoA lyase [Bdellovibrionales bacterium]